MTTAEAIERLTDLYGRSQYCYSTNERVDEMSKVVSVNVQVYILIMIDFITCRLFSHEIM